MVAIVIVQAIIRFRRFRFVKEAYAQQKQISLNYGYTMFRWNERGKWRQIYVFVELRFSSIFFTLYRKLTCILFTCIVVFQCSKESG